MSGLDFSEVDDLLSTYEGQEAKAALDALKNSVGGQIPEADELGFKNRLVAALHILANCAKDDERRVFLEEAYGYVKELSVKYPDDEEVLQQSPMIVGLLSENANGQKERIRLGKEFKGYIDKAIEKLGDNFVLLHMRGRFRYEVASLSIIERGIAAVFFEAVPQATYQEALEDLLAADRLEPEALDNVLFIGKTYIALQDNQNAAIYLKRAIGIEAVDETDREQIEEAIKLLKSLSGIELNDQDKEQIEQVLELLKNLDEEESTDEEESVEESECETAIEVDQ